ncbi:Receptor-like serine/threonine-protein kinase ALE2 [Linum perenne]
MKMANEHDHDHDEHPNNDSLFRSLTFPRYCPKLRPTEQTRNIPATPRTTVINSSGATRSNSDISCSISSSSASPSSFFFTISSSSSSPRASFTLPNLRSCYRCIFRGRDAIGFRRPSDIISPEKLRRHLSATSNLHHANVVKLIGASVSEINEPCSTVDLIYQFVDGPTLSDCLNPGTGTAVSSSDGMSKIDVNDPYHYVSTWKSRMEIALGVASGLVYIHHMTGFNVVFVHNRIKSSNIILTSATRGGSQIFRPKICNFGLSRVGWHALDDEDDDNDNDNDNHEHEHESPNVMEDEEGYSYMAPELVQQGGIAATQKSDVYAFGVLLLELLSGTRPSTYSQTSIVETARMMFDDEVGIEKMVRLWVDRRFNDSFPVKNTVELLRVALMYSSTTHINATRNNSTVFFTRNNFLFKHHDLIWLLLKESFSNDFLQV